MRKGPTRIYSLHAHAVALALTVAVLLFPLTSPAQQLAYESPGGTKFLLFTPPGYSTNTSDYPLLLSLHSKGEVGDDLTLLTSENREQMPSRLIYLNKWPATLPFIVLTPQLKPDPDDPEIQWSADYIDEVVTYVLNNFRIDEQRIYVTGISRGGTGAWTYAAAFPEKVAALLPISGRSDLAQACPIKNIPVWAFHGDGDDIAPTQYSIDMVNAIKACQPAGSYTPRLNILNARDHIAWNDIYNGSSGYDVFSWLLRFTKNDLSNQEPYVNAGRDLRVQLRARPLSIYGDFFDWDGSVANIRWRQISGTPLSLSGVQTGLLQIIEPKAGTFEFQLSVTDDNGAQRTDNMVLEIIGSAVEPRITQLILVDGKTNIELGDLSEGQVIDKSSLGLSEINVKALASAGTASVRFSVNADEKTRLQNTGPYYIKHPTNYPEWVIRAGVYVICATPYSKVYGGGVAGVSQCYKITVTDGLSPTTCPGTGTIERELWTGVSGRYTSSIPVGIPPSSITNLTTFETPRNTADYYGSRVRGYVCVPTTGNYTFWIASDDTGELWLSTDDQPANKRKIANVSGWTNYHEWTKYTSQKSAAVTLVAGRRYYIEALHKEASGGDHLSVGWQLPDATIERPIPGNRLMPFAQPTTPTVSITSPADGQTFVAPASVNISANASAGGASILRVEFYNGTAKLSEDATAPYTFNWLNVPEGRYTIKARALDNAGGSSIATVDITVTNASSCAGSGIIQQEVWLGITGRNISSIPLTSPPSTRYDLNSFASRVNIADNYGSRMRGYVCVPTTGSYVFWIASDDNSELWLSTDEDPANKVKIAYVSGWTRPAEWAKYATQQSALIHLVAGRRYYIEALLKEATGGDHLAVGWRLPDGTMQRPIPGNYLSPYAAQMTARQLTSESTTADKLTASPIPVAESISEVFIYPNPVFQYGIVEIRFPTPHADGDTHAGNRLEIVGVTGEVLFSATLARAEHAFSFHLDERFVTGVYMVRIYVGDHVYSRRLVVR